MATTTTGVSIPLTSSKDVYPSPSSPGKSVFALPGERGFALPGERGFTTPSSPGKEVYPSPASPSKSGFALPSSPSKSGFPLPSSPSKIQTPLTSPTLSSTDPSPSKHKFDRPNPHPYAIKTTSTALLARSNSSSGNVSAQRHAYVPVPVSPGHSRGGDNSSGGGGHRYTRSLSGVGDIPVLPPGTLGARPLPAPPELRRATLPVDVPSTPMDELPENPKLWTPAQLSAYLAGALRVRGEGTRLPERVVSDVASFVRQARIGGRAFLRLNEADLEGMGVNKLWRTALLNASRNLRQNVLKGRIWPSPTASPNPNSSDNSDIETKAPTSTENVYGNTLYASSDSSLSSAGEVEDIVATPFTKAKRSRVKVRERVRDFEERSRSRSASEVSDSDNAGPAGEGKIERVKRVKSRPLPVPPTHTTSPVPPAMHSATPSPNPGPSVRRQLPKPPFSFSDNEEEPSMEALLAQADRSTWGARAWEEIDDGVGIVTVKHVPGEPPAMGTASGNATLVRNEDWMKGTISRGTGKTKERGRGRVVTSIFQGLDEDGQGISRESSGDSEESAGVTDVSSLGEVEKDTTVLVAEPLVKDAEVQSLNGNTVDAEVQSPVVVTADAEVQSLVISTVDAEVQLPIISTTDAEVQSPVILTADAQVQSPVVPASDAAIQVEDQEESDKLKGVIQQLERKLEESKLVIEDFKKRLEGVEMESVKEQVSPSVSVSDGSTRTSPDSNAPVVRSPRTRVGLAASLVSRMFGLVGLGSRSPTAGAGDGEMGVGDLPSYVFLVGLGVCAVVLKVIVKRVKRGLR